MAPCRGASCPRLGAGASVCTRSRSTATGCAPPAAPLARLPRAASGVPLPPSSRRGGDVRRARARGPGRLGAAVHEGAPLPGVAERLAGLDPALVADALARPAVGPLVDALAWVHALDPERLAAALGVVVARVEGLGGLVAARPDAVALTVGLLDLALDAPRGPAAAVLARRARRRDGGPRGRPRAARGPGCRPFERRRPAAADDGRRRARRRRWARRSSIWPATPCARARRARPDAGCPRGCRARRSSAGPPGGPTPRAPPPRAAASPGRRAARPTARSAARSRALRALARAPGRRAWLVPWQATRAAARLSPAAGERLLDVLARVDPLVAPAWAAAARLALVTSVSNRRQDPARGLGVLAQVLRAAPGAFGADVVMLALELVDEGARLLRHAPLVVEALTDLARRRGRLDPALGLTLALEHAARVGEARGAAAFLRAAEPAVSPRTDLPPLLVALCGRGPALPAVLAALGAPSGRARRPTPRSP
ncbi:MAG: hypothetical protein KF878_34145 [Planctomycetes bacterium]|nr:hypothetical protein [Planctomycetota bacterium]